MRGLLEMAAGPQPDDTALRWRGTAEPDKPVVRVAHYGDCSWREMPLSHGIHTWPGYPRAMAEELARDGLGMEFSSWVVFEHKWLPGPEQLDQHLRLSGDPDLVLVHIGSLYSRLIVLPDTPGFLRLRQRISRRLGRAVFAAYRPLRPLVAAFGRFAVDYEGAAGVAPFLDAVQARWPDARVVVLLPYPRSEGAHRQHAMAARVRADLRAAAEAGGVECVDLAPELGSDRCANGYNLGAESSARVGRRLARLVRQPARA